MILTNKVSPRKKAASVAQLRMPSDLPKLEKDKKDLKPLSKAAQLHKQNWQYLESPKDLYLLLQTGEMISPFTGQIIKERFEYFIWCGEERYTKDLFEYFFEYYPDKAVVLFSSLLDADYLNDYADYYNQETDSKRRAHWEKNHRQILLHVRRSMMAKKEMPTPQELSNVTGLSRPTIYRHLEQIKSNPLFQRQAAQLDIGLETLTASLLSTAIYEKDMRAAALYVKIATHSSEMRAKSRQTNYIQVNNTRIDINQLENLDPEKLALIESILTGGPLPPNVCVEAATDGTNEDSEKTENTLKLISQ